ncbi:MAG TPA: 50S ribosomal protein L11 methyltransferase [Longimicrobiales bacterium]|nr:50S ribosomal protein L11 methyltransferase [Longimicrobiales bacterium]
MPQTWLRVTATSPSAELTGLLAEGLLACGGSAVEEKGDVVVTYIADDDGNDDVDTDRAAQLRHQLHAILGFEPLQLEVERVPEQDWLALWRAGLEPRHIGERIIVSPTWSEVSPGPGQLLIRIDPQMAFGTGEHASTRGVLRLMQRVVRDGDRLIDVGSGSAILAIAAARLGASHVFAVESDPDAQENAGENVAQNEVADRVTLLYDLVDNAFLAGYGGGAFDGILANVLSGVLRPLLPAFHRALAEGGWAILSGILVEEAPLMREAADAAGFTVEAEDVEEQWWSVLLRRAGP